MASLDPVGNYDTKFYATLSGSVETAYTVLEGSILIQQIRCVVVSGVARTIVVTVRQTASGADFSLTPAGCVIPALTWLDLEFDPLVVANGGIIKVTAAAAGVHVQISYAIQSRRI